MWGPVKWSHEEFGAQYVVNMRTHTHTPDKCADSIFVSKFPQECLIVVAIVINNRD